MTRYTKQHGNESHKMCNNDGTTIARDAVSAYNHLPEAKKVDASGVAKQAKNQVRYDIIVETIALFLLRYCKQKRKGLMN